VNIWIKQLDRGPFTRLTFGGSDRRPIWSPDGQTVAFLRDSLNSTAVYARPADGSGQERLLARIDRQVQEATWSHDGQWIVVRTDNGARGAGDLVGVRVNGDTSQVPVVATGFTELHPALSPDAVRELVARGLRLFGVDAPSVDLRDSRALETHRALFAGGAWNLENLDLRAVTDGEYDLTALPLRLSGLDAAPVRALLRTGSAGAAHGAAPV